MHRYVSDGYRVDGPVRHQEALEGATVEFVLHPLQRELSSANPQVHQSQQRTVCAAHRPREAPSTEPVYGWTCDLLQSSVEIVMRR